MDENPYETPLLPTVERLDDGITLTAHLREAREAQRRWSRCCWLFGGVAIFLGVFGYNVSQCIFAAYRIDWLVATIDVMATSLIVAAFGLIAFGPIARLLWFGRRR